MIALARLVAGLALLALILLVISMLCGADVPKAGVVIVAVLNLLATLNLIRETVKQRGRNK